MELRFVLNRVSEWHHCYFWTKCEEPDSNSPVLLQLPCGLSILVTGIVVMGKGMQEGHGIVSVTQSGSQFKGQSNTNNKINHAQLTILNNRFEEQEY